MKRFIVVLSALLSIYGSSLACTSAIITAQRSSEGVPLLWKHRDSSFSNTRVDYIEGGKYAYTAIVPNTSRARYGMMAGINEVGVASISTSTRALPVATPEEFEACTRPLVKASIYRLSLQECGSVDEFEELLKTTKRKRGFKGNIGMADASGAVAYFEIWDIGYRRYNTNEMADGFDVRSNFSHAAVSPKRGASERRYNLIMQEMKAHNGNFTPQQLINYSRSYNSCKYGDVLATDKRYYCSNHTVPRHSSVASIVLVCDKENPRMLVTNGHPVSSVAVPVYVKAKYNIPKCVKGDAMRILSEEFRALAYTKTERKGYIILNKEVVRKVLAIKQPTIDFPKVMPQNIKAFNADIDKKFAKYEKRVRKVLKRFK